MNILWIFNMPLCPEAGGTERVTSLVQKGLRAIGHTCYDILVVKADEGRCFYDNTPVLDVYAFLKEKHVDVVINQYALSAVVLDYFLDHGGRRWQAEGGKVITCLHFNPEPVDYLYTLKLVLKPSVRKFVQLCAVTLFRRYFKKKQDRQAGELYRDLCRKSDAFLLLAESHRDYMMRVLHSDLLPKLHVVHNPLTFDSIADETVLKGKQNVVLVVSRLEEYYKRFSLLLRIWKEMYDKGMTKGWELKIVGTGNEMDRYRSYVEDNHLTNVSFEGRQDPLPYYRMAKIFMMTSVSEGLPMTILESFQQGVVPIVMNSCPIFSELIENGRNGVLSPEGDIKAYEENLSTLMNDTGRLVAMGVESLKSSNLYRMENIMGEWERLFSNLLN